MMQPSRGSAPLAAMPASNGATSWHSESRQARPLRLRLAERAPPARLLRRQQPLTRVDRLDRGVEGGAQFRIGAVGACPKAIGEIPRADLAGVAGRLRRTRRAFRESRRRSDGRGEGERGAQDQGSHQSGLSDGLAQALAFAEAGRLRNSPMRSSARSMFSSELA